jgi:predicted nucleic-acid-binding Zn-ribbon protein
MGGFWNGLKRAVKSLADGPDQFEVEGKPVRCPHCGHDRFAEGEALLNTVGMTALSMDWANRTASTLMCAGCGRIEWFGQKPTKV